MAFCPNCGTQAGSGAFCPNCGSAITAPAGTTASPEPPPSTPPPSSSAYAPVQSLSAPGMGDNVAGALCYLGGIVTGIIFLILAPYNQSKFVRFHAFQSIFLCVGWIVSMIVVGMLFHFLAVLIGPLLGLAFFVIWLYLMYSAFNNNKVKLPIIGELAEKQA